MNTEMAERERTLNISGSWLYGLLVSLCAFLVYANSLVNGFTLDDHVVIVNNPALHGSALALFKMVDAANDSQLLPFYRPLGNLTFLLDGQLHGFNPFIIRLFNVLLHSANAFLVYLLARTIFKNYIYAPLLAGLLFATHPLHTEGVNFNAGGRITMMACFFSILAYLLHNKSILREKTAWAYAGALMFLAGLFSKEIALMILPIIAALELPALRNNTTRARLEACFRLAPYFLATAIYLILRWLALSRLGIQSSILPGVGTKVFESLYVTTDLGTRLSNNVYIIPRYLLTVIWPTALASRYIMPEDLNLLALPLVSAWLCILGGLGWLVTKGRSAVSLFGLSWVFLFWLPVSGIVLVPGAPLADRFLYIPAIGLWIIISDQIAQREPVMNPAIRRYGKVALAIILLLLAAVTIRRNMDWKSNITLYTRFVAQYPDNKHAHAGLGSAYSKRRQANDLESATRELEKVLKMDPVYPRIHTLLGNIKLNQEDLSGALNHYNEAITLFPHDKEARINRAITYEKLGRKKEALSDYLFFLTIPGTDNTPRFRRHAEERMRELAR